MYLDAAIGSPQFLERKNKDTGSKGQPAEKRNKANETTSNDKWNDETVITHMLVASLSKVQSKGLFEC